MKMKMEMEIQGEIDIVHFFFVVDGLPTVFVLGTLISATTATATAATATATAIATATATATVNHILPCSRLYRICVCSHFNRETGFYGR